MPANAKLGQIVSLVQITDDHAPTIALPPLTHELHVDIAALLPIIDAAEMLG
jgi:hypothetical protein